MTPRPAISDTGPPLLPGPPPDRFQFHLKHLLAFMLVSAFIAALLRPVFQAAERLPDGWIGSWFGILTLSVVGGGLAYFVVRGPFLIWHAARLARRWDAVQSHRRELLRWANAHRRTTTPIMLEDGQPPAGMPPDAGRSAKPAQPTDAPPA